ncbi:hypothetical protein GCM10011318_04810 [Phaeocystidibacter marisrubri]|nr:hypothetical protein GCM10011318_04810 [Phaeocystidibacter marisrubri]
MGYGYNINEFGNVVFGAANSKKGNIGLTPMLLGGYIYSLFANGRLDETSEVQAVTRGYNYYHGFQQPSSEEAPFMP